MKRYEKYKDSGVVWIGEIPEGWEVKPLKTLGQMTKGVTFTKADIVEEGNPAISYGQIHSKDNKGTCLNRNLIRYIPDNFIKGAQSSLVNSGGFIFADTSEDLEGAGNAIYIDEDVQLYGGYHTIVFKTSTRNNKYLSYLFLTDCWRSQIRSQVSGVKVYSITQSILSSTKVIMPPLSEQQSIANYLDAKCGKIDKVIAVQEKRVELLRELKQSIITRAVTRGIPSTSSGQAQAKMKDSGVEWIGEIPEHWEVRRFRTSIYIVRGGSPRPIEQYLSEEGYNWIKIGDTIKGNKYITSTAQKIKKEGLKSTRLVKPGDLILSNSMSFGQPYILAIEGCIHDGWLSLSPTKDLDKEYLYYILVSDVCKNQFASQVDGGVVQNLNIDKVKDSFLFIPPLAEQQQIVTYIEQQTSRLDSSIAKSLRQIELLKEYKQSLITEVVTGKRKVC